MLWHGHVKSEAGLGIGGVKFRPHIAHWWTQRSSRKERQPNSGVQAVGLLGNAVETIIANEAEGERLKKKKKLTVYTPRGPSSKTLPDVP